MEIKAKTIKFVTTQNSGGIDIDDLKTSVSDGKAAIASAITGKGVSTSPTAAFSTMATNIGKIKTSEAFLEVEATGVTPLSHGRTINFSFSINLTGKIIVCSSLYTTQFPDWSTWKSEIPSGKEHLYVACTTPTIDNGNRNSGIYLSGRESFCSLTNLHSEVNSPNLNYYCNYSISGSTVSVTIKDAYSNFMFNTLRKYKLILLYKKS